MGLLSWIIVGLIAGALAGFIMKSERGVLGDILLGIIGAIVGGFISSALLNIDVTGINITSILIATVGAIIVIAISRALRR